MQKHMSTIRVWLALAPPVTLLSILVLTSLLYALGQSLGVLTIIGSTKISLDAYAKLLLGNSPTTQEFWPALGFSLWISTISTLLSATGAMLLAILLTYRRKAIDRLALLSLNTNLSFPHLVWAVTLSLLLAQSGLLARMSAALGLISMPAEFPVLVRDRYGLGIILHYMSKEIPFLTLIVLAVIRTQGHSYDLVAENLGANAWQRLRYVTLPLVLPALSAGAALVFAFVFGNYEVPALLGVRYPRTLSVLALEFFLNPDLNRRAEGMAMSLLMGLIVLGVLGLARVRRPGPQG